MTEQSEKCRIDNRIDNGGEYGRETAANGEILPIVWDDGRGALQLLDQNLLPSEIRYEIYETSHGVFAAIRDMKVRGAPAIGVAAAYGLYLGMTEHIRSTKDRGSAKETWSAAMMQKLRQTEEFLKKARPTAVNLSWALERMAGLAGSFSTDGALSLDKAARMLLNEALAIHREDEEINRSIGENLLTLLRDGMGILTHCNAGALATTRYGTALAPIYLAKRKGWHFRVYADETRPRLQGASLTAFELMRAGIDVTLITDGMAAAVMSQGKVDAVITGCDRVAANGDTANKVGTLGLSILAKHFGIPFYIAAPTPTIDLRTPNGAGIPIEERDPGEVTCGKFGRNIAPEGVKVYNPSFDITPAANITVIVTEKGIIREPFKEGIAAALGSRQASGRVIL